MIDMNWKKLEDIEQLDEIVEESATRPVVIFKHSIRCSISALTLQRLERKWSAKDHEQATGYLVDLIRNREMSDAVAGRFDVRHESPQVLVIRNGKSIFDTSHMAITYDRVIEAVNS